jgi:hypothetical protein
VLGPEIGMTAFVTSVSGMATKAVVTVPLTSVNDKTIAIQATAVGPTMSVDGSITGITVAGVTVQPAAGTPVTSSPAPTFSSATPRPWPATAPST